MSGITTFAPGGAGGLSVTVSPPSASAGGSGGGGVPAVTASIAGDPGPFTYAWTVVVPPETGALTISSPASASTGFVFSPAVPVGEARSASVKVTVTSIGTGAVGSRTIAVNYVNNTGGPLS